MKTHATKLLLVGVQVAVALWILACHAGTNNPPARRALLAAAPTPKAGGPTATPNPNPTYEAYAGPLVVSSDRGLLLLDPRGAIQATISAKPGHNPRWLRPGESLLVLRQNSLTTGGQPSPLALVEIDLASGSERVIAGDLIADTSDCPPGSVNEYGEELEGLAVQDDFHFRVSAERGLACAWLMDRNFNMHTLAVEAKVELADGALTRKILRACSEIT